MVPYFTGTVRLFLSGGLHSILAPVGDTQKIAESIVLRLQDGYLRQRLGRAAREHILGNYSTPHIR